MIKGPVRNSAIVLLLFLSTGCSADNPDYCDEATSCDSETRSFCSIAENLCIERPAVDACNRVEGCTLPDRTICSDEFEGTCVQCLETMDCSGDEVCDLPARPVSAVCSSRTVPTASAISARRPAELAFRKRMTRFAWMPTRHYPSAARKDLVSNVLVPASAPRSTRVSAIWRASHAPVAQMTMSATRACARNRQESAWPKPTFSMSTA